MPGILAFSIAFFCLRFSTTGTFYWFPTYFQVQNHFTKDVALDIFSYFNAGSFFGNVIMGLISDLVPIRSPVYIAGIFLATLFSFFLINVATTTTACAILGAIFGALNSGSSIVIAAIEMDISNFVKQKYNYLALGTFSGMIDGLAYFGGVIS